MAPTTVTGARRAVAGLWIIVGCAIVGLSYASLVVGLIVFVPRPGMAPGPPSFYDETIFDWDGAVLFGIWLVLLCWMLVVYKGLRHPPRDNPPLRIAVAIASVLSASVIVGYLLLLMVFVELTGAGAPSPQDKKLVWVYNFVTLSWFVALAVLVGTFLAARLARDPAGARRCWQVGRVVLLVVLLAPFAWPPILTLSRAVPVDVAVCVMTAAFVLWVVHGMQRHRRMPVVALLAGFGWGALVAIGFGATANETLLLHGLGIFRYLESIPVMLSAGPALFEELGKGAGVIAIYLFTRRWFDNVASGVVLGAAVGLGFNFSETLLYMAGDPEFQYWARQSLGSMAAHTAFTALVGAGIGIAHQTPSVRIKRIAVFAGFAAAMCAHLANNYLQGRMGWWFGLSDDPWISSMLLTPGAMLMLQGPFLLGYLLLLRRGLREQYASLRDGVSAEVSTGYGAIRSDEAGVLLDPARRFYLHVNALRRGGLGAYGRDRRLHAAQLDLAMLRSRQRRTDQPFETTALHAAGNRVLRLKAGPPVQALAGSPERLR